MRTKLDILANFLHVSIFDMVADRLKVSDLKIEGGVAVFRVVDSRASFVISIAEEMRR